MKISLFDLTPAARAFDERLLAMSEPARDELAREAQRCASALGLMRGPTPIPLVLSPSALPREELSALGRSAKLITSAIVKVARQIISREPARSKLLFHHLSPLEQEALATRWEDAEDLLHSRIDWFAARDGTIRALEVNATIPAMQVYSDAAAKGWAQAVAPSKAQAIHTNPSNAGWLIEAVIKAARERKTPLRVQLLHREGDPQVTELLALRALFRERGIEARTVTPTEVILDGDPHRVLYRHLFARNVEPGTPLGKAYLDPKTHGMWNRVDGWLETKGLYAELSLRSKAAYLTEAERATVQALVPWTRILDDVSDEELGTGDEFVLKRSHDYGGKSVVIGREAGPAAFRQALLRARTDDPASWVVQELVDAPSQPRFLCTSAGARRLTLHLDVSTYASLVEGVPDGGSVIRAAPGRIVNIVGGGGVAPLFADDVLQALL
jgi:hypothetical protein